METYYLIWDKLVAKRDDDGDWLYEDGVWISDTQFIISDHLYGYDPTEPEGSPYGFGSSSIMNEMRGITKEEAEGFMQRDACVDISRLELARQIAYEAHKNQTDRAGKPYTEHLEFVASHVVTDDEKCVAYMHDLFEDTDYPKEDILNKFDEEIYNAVNAMTHKDDEGYFDYVLRVKENPYARAVKLADLTNNMMLERLAEISEKDLRRVEKYKKAYALLME